MCQIGGEFGDGGGGQGRRGGEECGVPLRGSGPDFVDEEPEGLVAEAGAALIFRGRGAAERLGFIEDGEDCTEGRGEVGVLDGGYRLVADGFGELEDEG